MENQDRLAILFNEAKRVKLVELRMTLSEVIALQGFLSQKTYELRPKLRDGEAYIETLILKLMYSSKSVLRLSEKQDIEIYNYKEKLEVIDAPSIYILTRSIIETFLTLEYLFFDKVNDQEKDFRFNLWRVSGYISRQNFSSAVSEQYQEKLKNEGQLIEKIKEEIKQNNLYTKLKDNDIWRLDKYGLPRLKSWGNLLENSRLKSDMFKKVYSLYSNYAHSEFLAMMQLKDSNLHKDNVENIVTIETAIIFIQMINSVTILLLKERFIGLEEHYSKVDLNLKIRIELWSKIAMG